jgi:hypothetical protein
VPTTTTFDVQAWILHASAAPQFTSRAHILCASAAPQFLVQARIRAQVSAGLEVSFRITPEVRAQIPVRFNITDAERQYALFSCRAQIQASVEVRLPVDFTIDYAVPTDCVLRPTQRTGGVGTGAAIGTATLFYCRAFIVSSVPPV